MFSQQIHVYSKCLHKRETVFEVLEHCPLIGLSVADEVADGLPHQ